MRRLIIIMCLLLPLASNAQQFSIDESNTSYPKTMWGWGGSLGLFDEGIWPAVHIKGSLGSFHNTFNLEASAGLYSIFPMVTVSPRLNIIRRNLYRTKSVSIQADVSYMFDWLSYAQGGEEYQKLIHPITQLGIGGTFLFSFNQWSLGVVIWPGLPARWHCFYGISITRYYF